MAKFRGEIGRIFEKLVRILKVQVKNRVNTSKPRKRFMDGFFVENHNWPLTVPTFGGQKIFSLFWCILCISHPFLFLKNGLKKLKKFFRKFFEKNWKNLIFYAPCNFLLVIFVNVKWIICHFTNLKCIIKYSCEV